MSWSDNSNLIVTGNLNFPGNQILLLRWSHSQLTMHFCSLWNQSRAYMVVHSMGKSKFKLGKTWVRSCRKEENFWSATGLISQMGKMAFKKGNRWSDVMMNEMKRCDILLSWWSSHAHVRKFNMKIVRLHALRIGAMEKKDGGGQVMLTEMLWSSRNLISATPPLVSAMGWYCFWTMAPIKVKLYF